MTAGYIDGSCRIRWLYLIHIYIYVDDGYYYYSLFHLLIVSKSATKLDRQRRIDGKAFLSLSQSVSLVQSLLPIVCERTPLWSHNSSRLVFFSIHSVSSRKRRGEGGGESGGDDPRSDRLSYFFLGPFSLSFLFGYISSSCSTLSCLQ